MRILYRYSLIEEPDIIHEIVTSPIDAVRAERHYKTPIGNAMKEQALEPLLWILHAALHRKARDSGGGVLPFDQWLENSLDDWELVEVVTLPPRTPAPEPAKPSPVESASSLSLPESPPTVSPSSTEIGST